MEPVREEQPGFYFEPPAFLRNQGEEEEEEEEEVEEVVEEEVAE